jgi:hypothetical protein
MDKDLELTDLGDAKEETKGLNLPAPREENQSFPWGLFPDEG